jgi:hypothetical protein
MRAAGATRSRGLAGITPSQRQVDVALAGLERVASPPVSLRLGAQWWQRTRLSVIAWWHAARLDRQLAAGASPHASAVLALRAQRITGRHSRMRVADGLARAIRDAQDTTPAFSAAVRPHRQEVLAARGVLATLDRRLRAPEPVTPRGVTLLQALLTDGTSPLYRPSEPGGLGSQLRAAAAALEPVNRCERPPETTQTPERRDTF